MANKKSDTKKGRKSKKEEAVVSSELTKMFVDEAKNTVFTEEDIVKKAAPEIVETIEDNTVFENVVEETGENGLNEPVKGETIEEIKTDTVETEKVEDNINEEKNDSLESEINEQRYISSVDIASDNEEDKTVVEVIELKDKEEVQPEVEKKSPRKRTTISDVYGYHWLGLVYDE